MAITVLTNAYVAVNGVDLSDHCRSVTIEDSRNPVDITAMGASNVTVTKGLGDGRISVELYQDTAAGKTHATLKPLIGSSTGVTIEVRPVNAARSATNEAATMTGLLMGYNYLDGSVGDASVITAEFQNAAQVGIQYLNA